MKNRKVLLCILDGWGVGKKNQFNAIVTTVFSDKTFYPIKFGI